jgi:hypothetical protein
MKVIRRTEGRRYSRRNVEVHTTKYGKLFVESLDHDDYLGAAALQRHEAAALAVLRNADIPVDRLLLQAESGSVLRDYVLNCPSHEPVSKFSHEPDGKFYHEPDSKSGIAARVVEICRHLRVYQAENAPATKIADLAYRLGRLTVLAKVCTLVSQQLCAAAPNPRLARRCPVRAAVVRAFKRHRQEDRSLKEALALLGGDDDSKLKVRFERDDDLFCAELTLDSGVKTKLYRLGALETLWTDAGGKNRALTVVSTGSSLSIRHRRASGTLGGVKNAKTFS